MSMFYHIRNQDGVFAVLKFLGKYRSAQDYMKETAAALLEIKKHVSPEQARQYDRVHKRMRAIMRDWNNLEHQRELDGSEKKGDGNV